MARQFVINGESLVVVRGAVNTLIAAKTELGLAADEIRVTTNFKHKDMIVDAWGSEVPVDVQWMLADCLIDMNLIHYDPAILDECLHLSMGYAAVTPGPGATMPAGGPGVAVGSTMRAGTPLGNNLPRFAQGNNYVGLTILSPVASKPYRFYYTYMTGPAMTLPYGTTKSITRVQFRAIPYTNDPYGGGTAQPLTVAGFGAQGATIWDNVNGD